MISREALLRTICKSPQQKGLRGDLPISASTWLRRDAHRIMRYAMKELLLWLLVVTGAPMLSFAEDATGTAWWQCGADAENLVVRVVNFRYMLTLNVAAVDRSPKDLSGLTRESRARVCFEGEDCISTKASVHYTHSDNHEITGDFRITLPDGKILQDHFKVKAYPPKPCA